MSFVARDVLEDDGREGEVEHPVTDDRQILLPLFCSHRWALNGRSS